VGYIFSIPKISLEAIAFCKKGIIKTVIINKKERTKLDKDILVNF
jgi:hypothetical protein